MKKQTLIYNIAIALVAVLVIVYLYPGPEENHFKFEEGRPWNYTKLIAPFDIPIRQDTAEISRLVDSLDHAFVPVYRRVPRRVDQVKADITNHVMRQVTEGNGLGVSDAVMLRRAMSYLDDAYRADVVDNETAERIEAGELPELRVRLTDNPSNLAKISTMSVRTPQSILSRMPEALRDTTATLWMARMNIGQFLKPNLERDDSLSDQLYRSQLMYIRGDKGVIQQGQTIIDKGNIISHQDYINICTYEEKLAENGNSTGQSPFLMVLGRLVYTMTLIAAMMVYLFYSCPDQWKRTKSMLFLFTAIVVFYLLAIGCEAFTDGGIYLVPFAVLPILLVVFLNAHIALFVPFILTLVCAPTVSFSLEFIALQFAGSVAAVYSLQELARRTQLLRTALFVLAAYMTTYLALELLMNGSFEGLTFRMAGYLCVSALLACTAYILMAVVEKWFGFVSVVTLVELCDVNNPMLRKLSEECPGTFQHSMAVGTLATDAALKIGANEQLVRAGALYHDIGKLSNPNFFTENQHGVNPHDALSPDQSAGIIIQHITDGVARADRMGLPEVIKDFIREHHGRGQAKYFYYTWCKTHPDADPAPFTYPGPNPRTRETSLLMMADSVEAASRSLKEYTKEAITALVNKIIDGQVADGLHNDSSLSFRDVKIIKEEFIKRLMTMYHSRISYPEDPNRQKNTGASPAQPTETPSAPVAPAQ